MVLLLLTALAAEPANLPAPFSAEQIQAACPVGTHIVMQLTDEHGVTELSWTVLTADAQGMTWQAELDVPGDADPPPQDRTATWEELRGHALFPANEAKRKRTRVSTPWGTLDAWRYDVRERGEEGVTRSQLWFADEMPGPPVRMTSVSPSGARSELVQVTREPFPTVRLSAGPVAPAR